MAATATAPTSAAACPQCGAYAGDPCITMTVGQFGGRIAKPAKTLHAARPVR